MLWSRKRNDKEFRLPPRPVGRRGNSIGVVAIFKDEAEYLQEWILFHQSAGFDRFYLYDNGSTDSSVEIAKAMLSSASVVIPWATFVRDFHRQNLAYAHAIANFGHECAWMAFIDIDEFLFPMSTPDIGSALSGFEDLPGVSVPWHMYGFSFHNTRPPGGVVENFLYRAEFPPTKKRASLLLKYKTIANPQRMTCVHTHTPSFDATGDMFFNETRQCVSSTERANPAYAISKMFRLNHYFTKDRESFEKKIIKGTVSVTSQEQYRNRLITIANCIEEKLVFDDLARRRFNYPG
jgi:hypothetical protein